MGGSPQPQQQTPHDIVKWMPASMASRNTGARQQQPFNLNARSSSNALGSVVGGPVFGTSPYQNTVLGES